MKKKKDKLQTTAKMGDSSCIAYHFPSEFDVRVRKKGATKLISDELQTTEKNLREFRCQTLLPY